MKKVVFCALNAKYIHSSLALRYLKTYSEKEGLDNLHLMEFSINDLSSNILTETFRQEPDILCFSCYIWNIEQILSICSDFKKVSPHTRIVLGGPEVSYDAEALMIKQESIDYIVRGEGEVSISELLLALNNDLPIKGIKGITYRTDATIVSNEERPLIKNLDEIPFPYQDGLDQLQDKNIYYESSRGCPFNCSYCLSSTIRGVRYFSLERVKEDLRFLLAHRVREIKFVDRTFNANEKRAMEIIQFIIDQEGQSKIHFEIEPGLLSDEMMNFLETVPPDLLNLEIGIQSTYTPALEAVNRRHKWDQISPSVSKLTSYSNLHVHLDLIAGLPYETYEQFGNSFNQVFSLHPDMLQLGFLKLLKGSDMRRQTLFHGYQYQDRPPYQVLSNKHITFNEMIGLQRIEQLLDRYSNSGQASTSISYICENIYEGDAFLFFESFARYWEKHHFFGVGHKTEKLYTYLKQFIDEAHPAHSLLINDLLKYDYLMMNHRYNLPEHIISYNPDNMNEQIYELLNNESVLSSLQIYLQSKTNRERRKQLHLEYFYVNPKTLRDSKEPFGILFVYDPFRNRAITTIPLSEIP